MIFHVIGYGDVEVDAKFVGAFVLADSVGRPEHHGFGHIANNPLETCTVDFVGHEHELLVPVIPVLWNVGSVKLVGYVNMSVISGCSSYDGLRWYPRVGVQSIVDSRYVEQQSGS